MGAKEKVVATHAHLAPSAHDRWSKCFASVALAPTYPKTSNKYADEGTAAHELASRALTEGQDAVDYLGERIFVNGKYWKVTGTMADYVQSYLNFVRSFDGKMLVEQRVSLTPVTGEPDAWGTADAVIVTDTELTIIDLKYGRGVWVDAADNGQLQMYAAAVYLSTVRRETIKQIRLVIIQPRVNNFSERFISAQGLQAFIATTKATATKALAFLGKPEADLKPTDYQPNPKACRWCPHKKHCAALNVPSTVSAAPYITTSDMFNVLEAS